jgi:hypothetical protein
MPPSRRSAPRNAWTHDGGQEREGHRDRVDDCGHNGTACRFATLVVTSVSYIQEGMWGALIIRPPLSSTGALLVVALAFFIPARLATRFVLTMRP